MTSTPPPPTPGNAAHKPAFVGQVKKKSLSRRTVALLAWTYLVFVVVTLGVLRLAGDRWWLATLLTFGPRWIVLAPLPTLFFLALFFHRRALAPILVAGLLGAGPIMGFCASWSGLAGRLPREGSPVLRVVTYNVGEGGSDPKTLGDFVRQTQADILILTEWMPTNEPAPSELGDGWHVGQNGGLWLLSRFPVTSVTKLGPEGLRHPWRAPALLCDLATPHGKIHVVAVHLDTPRDGLEAVRWSRWNGASDLNLAIEYRIQESRISSRLAAETGGPTLVAGDFNMPVDSAIYRRFWSDWQNAFSTVGWGYGHTKFTQRFGIRIDHVLASNDWRILKAHVGPDLGGDHRPVVVDLQLR